MNEVMNYNPDTYSINQTHSIYVHLEGTTLRLRRPRVNIPKRAMWDEPASSPQFIHQRHFDITGSRVILLPPNLVKKRLWSKKYPVCICLAKDGKKINIPQPGSHGYMMAHSNSYPKMTSSILPEEVGSTTHGFEVVNEQKCDTSIIYLFSRTCREKEQWYRRFDAAARGVPLPNHILEVQRILNKSSTRHRRSSSSDSLGKHKRQESTDSTSSASSPMTEAETLPGEINLKDFVMYMSRLIPKVAGSDSLPSSPIRKTNASGKDRPSEPKVTIPRGIICDPVLTPVNALLGRCFYDFLKDDYWGKVVQEKLQKKLSKIHVSTCI